MTCDLGKPVHPIWSLVAITSTSKDNQTDLHRIYVHLKVVVSIRSGMDYLYT